MSKIIKGFHGVLGNEIDGNEGVGLLIVNHLALS
jgi:hypothetical protein